MIAKWRTSVQHWGKPCCVKFLCNTVRRIGLQYKVILRAAWRRVPFPLRVVYPFLTLDYSRSIFPALGFMSVGGIH